MIITGFLTIFIGTKILIKNTRNPSNISFFLLCLFGGLWALAKAVQYSVFDQQLHDLFINKIIYFFGLATPLCYLILAYHFPYKLKKYSKGIIYLIFSIAFTILLLTLLGVLKFHETQILNDVLKREVIFSQYIILTIYYFLYILAGFFILLKKYFVVEGVYKYQIKYLIIATISVFILIGIVNVLLVLLNNFTYDWVGPIFLFIHFFIISYLIYFKAR